jgi:hypothetical protein
VDAVAQLQDGSAMAVGVPTPGILSDIEEVSRIVSAMFIVGVFAPADSGSLTPFSNVVSMVSKWSLPFKVRLQYWQEQRRGSRVKELGLVDRTTNARSLVAQAFNWLELTRVGIEVITHRGTWMASGMVIQQAASRVHAWDADHDAHEECGHPQVACMRLRRPLRLRICGSRRSLAAPTLGGARL